MVEVEAEYACLPEGAKAPKVRDSCLCLCKPPSQVATHAVPQVKPPCTTSCLPNVTICAGGSMVSD